MSVVAGGRTGNERMQSLALSPTPLQRSLRVAVISRAGHLARDRLVPISAAGLELVDRFELDNTHEAAILAPELDGFWATIAGHESYSRELFTRLPELQVVARPGVGYDRIDVDAATENGVAVLFAPGSNADAVADHTLGLILACLKNLPRADARVRVGAWSPDTLSGDLARATVGIVGLGAIGRQVARRLTGFDCTLLASETNPDHAFIGQLGIELVELHELLGKASVVTLHVPLSRSTRHLIGRRELELMRPDAILVNTCRGQAVHETALVQALEAGSIRGAALDVFQTEPLPPDHPLIHLDNVVLSGHVAGLSENGISRGLEAVVQTLLAIAHGARPTIGVVNPQVWALEPSESATVAEDEDR
jgi:D-3-phosphoglycerate dehydrogenase